jgi:hypothetical protein
MQNGFLKFALAVLGLLFSYTVANGQSPEIALARADSLFSARKYTQSLEVYTGLFNQKTYSPAMLLRMAFIEEGLSRHAEAIYYLNLYYNHTFDEAALRKIQDLAAAHRFSGYDQTDMDRLATAWRRYGYTVTLALALFALACTVWLLLSAEKKTIKTTPWIAQSVVMVLLLLHLNFPFQQKAIIHSDTAYLMSGPSAGASVVTKINGGHRVTVLGKHDVWVKIKWESKEVFIRESNVRPVEF